MRHKLSGLSIYELNGHRKEDEHRACIPLRLWRLYIYLYYVWRTRRVEAIFGGR